MNAPLTSVDQIKSTVIDLAIRFGPKVLVAVLETFRSHGIVMPFPQREVRLIGNA